MNKLVRIVPNHVTVLPPLKVYLFNDLYDILTLVMLNKLSLVLLKPDISCFANSVDPDQLASEEAI